MENGAHDKAPANSHKLKIEPPKPMHTNGSTIAYTVTYNVSHIEDKPQYTEMTTLEYIQDRSWNES